MSREYFNEKACIWDELIAEKDGRRLARLARFLNIGPSSTVLDVGTGTGVFLPFLVRSMGSLGRLVAIDFAENMLARAVKKNSNGNVNYIQADVTFLPLPDEIFDTVVCYSSFPHFRDKLKALREVHRVLTTEGRVFICHTSSRTAINHIHSEIPDVAGDLIPAESEMTRLLEAAGFEQAEVRDLDESYLATAVKNG
ncbi:MAG: methyltransferase domain-containing protein [Dehalococcoidia bacterium]|nr:methyltransferase domain-containing protein [Dehalococcoidia bacterium]